MNPRRKSPEAEMTPIEWLEQRELSFFPNLTGNSSYGNPKKYGKERGQSHQKTQIKKGEAKIINMQRKNRCKS